MTPISWLLPVIFLKVSFVCCDTEGFNHHLTNPILSSVGILKEATDEYLAAQKAFESRSEGKYPADCAALYQRGHNTSGVYRIWPKGYYCSGSFRVYCDMTTDGGGWTVIQRRGNFGKPKDDFFRVWSDYKTGFGNLTQDYWLGNDRIFTLTNQGEYTLRFDLTSTTNETRYAVYDDFWIESESYAYVMHVSGYTGTAGDSFTRSNDHKFSTKDRDNDSFPHINCAESYKGGWWYCNCHDSNLNALYLFGNHTSQADGINWKHWKGHKYSLKDTEMKLRPKHFNKCKGYNSCDHSCD